MHVQEALGKNSGCCPTLAASISCPVLGVRVLIYVGRCDMSAQFLVLLILDSSVAYSFELNVMIHYRHISTCPSVNTWKINCISKKKVAVPLYPMHAFNFRALQALLLLSPLYGIDFDS
jgi:hypothetical protein